MVLTESIFNPVLKGIIKISSWRAKILSGSSKGQLLPKGMGVQGDAAQAMPSPGAPSPTGAERGGQGHGLVAGSISSPRPRSTLDAGDPISSKRRQGQGNGCKQTQ